MCKRGLLSTSGSGDEVDWAEQTPALKIRRPINKRDFIARRKLQIGWLPVPQRNLSCADDLNYASFAGRLAPFIKIELVCKRKQCVSYGGIRMNDYPIVLAHGIARFEFLSQQLVLHRC